MGDDGETGFCVGFICAALIGVLAVLFTHTCCSESWKHDAIDRGYATYRQEGSRGQEIHFRWNNE